ncbi:caspase, EACC1-associated type [Phytohabitans flavus]
MVLMGVAEYASLHALPAVRNNLVGLGQALTRPQVWGLPESNLTVLGEVELKKAGEPARFVIDRLTAVAGQAEDALVVYYAGHGLPDEDGESDLYLALPTSVARQASYTALPFEQVRRAVRRSKARRKLVIIDCCYSGMAHQRAMAASDLGARFAIADTCVLTATTATRQALAPEGERYTAFTGELIRLLSTGLEDGPSVLDVGTLYAHLRQALIAKSLPEPDMRDRGLGARIAIARNLARQRAVAGGQDAAGTAATTGWGARSRYVQQVRDIAPVGGALGREQELAELADFCTTPAAGGGVDEAYVWWQAPPWAGKSALMSTFVLNPPAGVRVVSFFVTGRLAAQADSNAFTDALLEQLSTLTGQDLPGSLPPGQRDTYRRDLLDTAAAQAEQRGQRLVLVVDGLDEDHGGRPGSGIPSIASQLPKQPAHGMRIILAGRPHPPIPGDVPPDHPIRACRRRPLAPSEHAQQTAYLAKRELDELLAGDVRQRELVGVITASGGGLTLSELEELTGLAAFEVEGMLDGVCGRTLAGRADYALTQQRQLFLFAHETLRAHAEQRLGKLVTVYRDKIHQWIDSYRQRRWPPGTPAYALHGYFQMLTDQHDLERMLHLAVDPRRHDRMLDITGGDTAALTEIRTLQDRHLQATEPDLYALARLCVRRTTLADRNANIPTDLPAVWATLGHTTRAEALTNAITDPNRQAQALTALVTAAAKTGDYSRAVGLADQAEQIVHTITDLNEQAQALSTLAAAVGQASDHDRVTRLADRAEQIARTITDPYRQAQVLAPLATALAQAGDLDRAEQIARTITNPYGQAQALTDLATALAQAGHHDRAEQIAHTITNPRVQTQALAALATALAQAGHYDRATGLADRAEQIARTFTDPYEQAQVLAALATALAQAGHYDRATGLADRAEQIAHTITDPTRQARMPTALASAFAQAGHHDRAEQIARTITDPHEQARALTALAAALAQAGHHDRATGLADQAEQIAHTFTDPNQQAQVLAALARALAQAGHHDRAEQVAHTIPNSYLQALVLAALATALAQAGHHDRAEQVAHTITDPHEQAQALTDLATALAQAGHHDHATGLADQAEQIARTITDPYQQAQALTDLATALAQAGHHDRAEQIARTITDPNQQAQVLAALATALAQAGHHDRATGLADQAEQIAHTITDPNQQAQVLAALATALAQAGHHDRATGLADQAEQIAHTITDPNQQAQVLAALATALAQAGHHDRATGLADQAEQIAHTITDRNQQAWMPTALAPAFAQAGHHDRAEQIAHTITNPTQQALVLAALARVLAQAGHYDRATGLADRAEQIAHTITDPNQQAQVLAALATALAQAGHHDRAERIAHTIPYPHLQAYALTELAAQSFEARSRKLLGTALTIGDWSDSVGQLIRKGAAGNRGLLAQLTDEGVVT